MESETSGLAVKTSRFVRPPGRIEFSACCLQGKEGGPGNDEAFCHFIAEGEKQVIRSPQLVAATEEVFV